VPGGGIGISMRIENRELIENSRRSKRTIRQNRVQLERIWHVELLALCLLCISGRLNDNPQKALWEVTATTRQAL